MGAGDREVGRRSGGACLACAPVLVTQIVCPGWGDVACTGVSVSVYFRLVKALAIVLFVMSIIAGPSLYISWSGGRIDPQDVDPLKTNLLSIANVNVDWILGYALSPNDASELICLSDLAYSLAFMVFIFVWSVKFGKVLEAIDEEVTMTSDYAVRTCFRTPAFCASVRRNSHMSWIAPPHCTVYCCGIDRSWSLACLRTPLLSQCCNTSTRCTICHNQTGLSGYVVTPPPHPQPPGRVLLTWCSNFRRCLVELLNVL